ncbi:hypothetical protein FLONG3_6688 [Fusarium longipes]|uniref:Uncharacterized protein n=1 Tax=Fusarium longipes TaxID=694270 RepID=A0A395SJS0_9HYPO|nr:hypothetical protein FLONG3_6688 [Fusarium longipes]
MPPYAADLETWWLGSGYDAIKELMNNVTDELDPWQCGFAQQTKSRLFSFDNDAAIKAQIMKNWPAIRAARGIDYDANSRKYAKHIASTIFRKPEEGGIDFDLAMNGLGYLDAMEIRRLRLIKATNNAIQASSSPEGRSQILEELERTSSTNFKKLHSGLRICILTRELTKDINERKETTHIMALLNALMPSAVLLGDEDDIDPTPHSSGVRDNVRFSVFEHLISKECFTQERQEILQMKLRCWCDIPDYPRIRNAMVRYCEEFKKVEEICLKTMNDLETRSGNMISYHAVASGSSLVSSTDTSCNSGQQANSLQTGDIILTLSTSRGNQGSAKESPISPRPPLAFHPLLRGTPGRELSPAKTDGALLARDTSEPPVACYPDDHSKTLFYQHPFARKLTYLAPGVLSKIKRKMNHQPGPPGSTRSEDMPFQPLDECMANSTTSRSSHSERPPIFASNIPQPEPFAGVDHWRSSFDDNSHGAPSVSHDIRQSPRQLTTQDTDESHTQQAEPEIEDLPRLVCQLAKPRISPMEYARTYLLEKSLASRESRQCELPRPDIQWHWTPRFKKFLIIPRIPKNIRRDLEPHSAGSVLDADVQEMNGGHQISTLVPEKDYIGLLRLSLQFGKDPVLLPFFPDEPDSERNDKVLSHPQGSSKAMEDSNSSEVREGQNLVISPRGPAGGRVEDWRPMSEYETDEDDEGSDATMPASVGDDESTITRLKATRGAVPSPKTSASEIKNGSRCRIAPGVSGKCSSRSHNNFETAAQREFSDQVDANYEDDARNLTLSRQLSRVCTKDLSVLDFATPRTKEKMIDNTASLLTTVDGHSPLARFPIRVQPTQRLTPGTLAKRVVGDSGGQLLCEDTRKVHFTSTPKEKPPQGLQADLWDIDAESMISELQPEPLQINRQRPRANTDDDRRWSRMFDELNTDVPSTIGMLGINASLDSGKTMNHEFDVTHDDDNDDDDNTATEGDHTPRASWTKIQSVVGVTPVSRGLQRSASTIITPTQSDRRLRHQASYNPENVEHSGFTPEHRRESTTHGTFPRSDVMLNLQDTQTRLRHRLQEPEESHISRSLDDTTPKVRNFNGMSETDQYKQNSIKEWVKSISMTPRKPKIVSHSRTEGDRDLSTPRAQIASHGTFDRKNTQSSFTSSTRDFSQPQKLQKQQPKPSHTPSSSHPFPKQRPDTHSRAQSPLPPAGEQALAHIRTPSPTERSIAVPWTPSSGISSVLRRRVRSGYSAPATPRTPRTPASPQLAWRPFDDNQQEPPSVSPWLSGHREIKREREKRIAFFREKAELELEEQQSSKRSSRKSSFGSIVLGDHEVNRNGSALDNRMSSESLVTWRNFIQDAPEPLFSSPPPPIPPLPTESQLNLALDRLQKAQTPSRAVAGVETTSVTSYRTRKPQGLRVDTDWARKPARDGTRTPSRNTGMKHSSGSSNRTTVRLDGRQMSVGRAEREGERHIRGRDDEVISRRK